MNMQQGVGQKMKMRIIAVLFIFVGFCLIGAPKLSAWYHDAQQKKLMKQWQVAMAQIHNGEEDDPQQADPAAADAMLPVGPSEEENADPIETSETQPQLVKPDLLEGMEGILSISSIDLSLPVLRGATEKNMKTTVASIESTGAPGLIGNYAIAGHRNFTYGRNFNRLDEMQEGDMIEVDTGEMQYEYVVTEKLYVKPEEVWVLQGNGEDREITLITCHPMKNPTHRLIIKGKIKD